MKKTFLVNIELYEGDVSENDVFRAVVDAIEYKSAREELEWKHIEVNELQNK